MKNIFLGITVVIFLMCGANAFAQTKQTDDEKAIDALVMNVGTAWETSDMNKFADLLTEDCTHINPFGKEVNGREAIRKHLQWVMENVYPKGTPKLEVSEYSVRFVRSDVALVTFLGKESTGSFREIIVVTKVKNDWKIASFQGIAVTEPPKINPN